MLYDLMLENGKLARKAAPKSLAQNPWRLNRYFLEQVAKHPESYIFNPTQLNWNWLTDCRIGH